MNVASMKVGYFVSNKAKLCQGYLIKCANFNNQVLESERNEISGMKCFRKYQKSN